MAELTAAAKVADVELQWLQLPGVPDSIVGVDRLCAAARDVCKTLPSLAAEAVVIMNESYDKMLTSARVRLSPMFDRERSLWRPGPASQRSCDQRRLSDRSVLSGDRLAGPLALLICVVVLVAWACSPHCQRKIEAALTALEARKTERAELQKETRAVETKLVEVKEQAKTGKRDAIATIRKLKADIQDLTEYLQAAQLTMGSAGQRGIDGMCGRMRRSG